MSGRDADFSDFVAAQWQRLLRAAVLLGCSLPEAEDVAQATLLRCYTKWHLVARADNRAAYAATVLVNVHRESRRRRSAGERPMASVPEPAGHPGAPDEAERWAEADAVRRALGGLSAEQREVVLLRYYLQLSEREAADALRVAPGTVKSRLSRALKAMAGSVELASFRAATAADTAPDTEGES